MTQNFLFSFCLTLARYPSNIVSFCLTLASIFDTKYKLSLAVIAIILYQYTENDTLTKFSQKPAQFHDFQAFYRVMSTLSISSYGMGLLYTFGVVFLWVFSAFLTRVRFSLIVPILIDKIRSFSWTKSIIIPSR